MRPIDLRGARFGRLTVITKEAERGKGRTAWQCKCDCGTETSVLTSNLRAGRTKSCGCLGRTRGITHGQSRTRTYRIWRHILSRCRNHRNKRWSDYGGRGIAICERWMSFDAFLADMGEAPPGASIDRIDNDGDYSPENCRWATAKQQQRNTRRSKHLTFRGQRRPMAEWAEVTGVGYRALVNRIWRGWSVERALTEPVQVKS